MNFVSVPRRERAVVDRMVRIDARVAVELDKDDDDEIEVIIADVDGFVSAMTRNRRAYAPFLSI
jgi:hypothetical protein